MKNIFKLILFLSILALAGISCGVSNIGNLFATETPTPTSTYTPTPTFTPSPTSTSTPTSTPTATPRPTGVASEEQADGSTLFIDYDNQFQLIIPDTWLVIPLSSEDITDILGRLSEENPDFEDTADAFSNLDSDVIRVIAINEDRRYIFNSFSTNLTIAAVEDKIMSSMPLDFITGAMEESLKQQGATVISEFEPASKNANGVEIGSFEFQQVSPTVSGTNVRVQSKSLIFHTNNKLIMIQLAVPQQFAEELLPILDEVANSIKIIQP